MTYVITERGGIEDASPKNGSAYTVDEMQDIVGGYIDIADVGSGIRVFDIDGMEKGKIFNSKATAMLKQHDEDSTTLIAGNVLFCTREMIRV